jgi:DNA segregation ATPase FtsK/SpoIIIE-like protein
MSSAIIDPKDRSLTGRDAIFLSRDGPFIGDKGLYEVAWKIEDFRYLSHKFCRNEVWEAKRFHIQLPDKNWTASLTLKCIPKASTDGSNNEEVVLAVQLDFSDPKPSIMAMLNYGVMDNKGSKDAWDEVFTRGGCESRVSRDHRQLVFDISGKITFYVMVYFTTLSELMMVHNSSNMEEKKLVKKYKKQQKKEKEQQKQNEEKQKKEEELEKKHMEEKQQEKEQQQQDEGKQKREVELEKKHREEELEKEQKKEKQEEKNAQKEEEEKRKEEELEEMNEQNEEEEKRKEEELEEKNDQKEEEEKRKEEQELEVNIKEPPTENLCKAMLLDKFVDIGAASSVLLVFSDGEQLCHTFPLAAREDSLKCVLLAQ